MNDALAEQQRAARGAGTLPRARSRALENTARRG
jgi:hypothetical protein